MTLPTGRPESIVASSQATRPSTEGSPLAIAVIGPGGIGSTFAYQLSRAGHDVTVVARPGSARLAVLERDGGIVRDSGERAAMRVTAPLDEDSGYDLVIVTTPVHQLEPLIEPLKRSRASCVHFMFNIFDPETLQQRLSGRECTFGMPFVMGSLDKEGRLNARISGSRRTLHSDQRWVTLFDNAGIPSAFEPEMMSWLRSHVPMCIAMESISVAGQRRGKGASIGEARIVAAGLRAGFIIIKGLGYRLHPSKKRISETPTVLLAAIFRELLATGVRECVDLIGTMAAAAGKKPALAEAAKALISTTPTRA